MSFDLDTYRNKIAETKRFLKEHLKTSPQVGIILGSGLGGLVQEIDIIQELNYEDIPNFPVSTVESHDGKLILGTLSGKTVLAMQGRFHIYEGYSMQEIVFPIRLMHDLGIKTLIISNAAGGMNPQFSTGDIMVIEDHINLFGDNPLIGPNLEEYGPRFPDMSEPYSKKLIAMAEKTALEKKIVLQKGVYVAVTGPNLETRAEYRFLRTIGADVVGMSTIPENIAAVHMGMDVLAFSVITDECFPDALKAVNVEEILATARSAEPKLTLIMKEVIGLI
ncbi:MAG: purine-nucleoside phosphorylase [Calditrichaeota bacterium]|nr:MAG: purine-nucleoside phosphorylase [Calditrichota bacterium]MBL1204409.1 purine-nucleoside phosphorylase [Calditrichota bacterium]NOG44238.1 purine-nucleoside phosphorylase [Calditrichota bacterium]